MTLGSLGAAREWAAARALPASPPFDDGTT